MSLLFNILSRLVIAFLPRSKCLFISWLQSPSTVILKPTKIKTVTISIVSPSICHEVMGPDAIIFIFRMLSFKPAFHCPLTIIKRLFSSSLLFAIRVVSSAYLRLLKYGLFIYKQKVKLSASFLPTIQCWCGNRITIMRLLLEKGRIINTNSPWAIVIAKHT